MTINQTIRDQVTDQIRNEVVSGRFPAGQPLREREFANRYGVSNGPVRDAFLQLAQEGFLAYQANRGVTVRQPPSPENQEFIISLRQQIEAFVIQDKLDRFRDEETIRPVAETLKHLKAACVIGEVADIAVKDMAFHQAILQACGGSDFLPIWKWLCSQMMLIYSRLDDYMQVYEEHQTIFEALQNGKKDAVISAIKANIR